MGVMIVLDFSEDVDADLKVTEAELLIFEGCEASLESTINRASGRTLDIRFFRNKIFEFRGS